MAGHQAGEVGEVLLPGGGLRGPPVHPQRAYGGKPLKAPAGLLPSFPHSTPSPAQPCSRGSDLRGAPQRPRLGTLLAGGVSLWLPGSDPVPHQWPGQGSGLHSRPEFPGSGWVCLNGVCPGDFCRILNCVCVCVCGGGVTSTPKKPAVGGGSVGA